jgi:hypothetical protein
MLYFCGRELVANQMGNELPGDRTKSVPWYCIPLAES